MDCAFLLSMNYHSPMPPRILLDFDGTVTLRDTVDAVLEEFALPEWHDVEAEWEAGLIGSRECLTRQVALIRATPEAMDRFVDSIDIDPTFIDLVMMNRRLGTDLEIVSDGFERSVRRIMRRLDFSCPVRANMLLPVDRDRWTLLSPHSKDDCRSKAGTCKCAVGRGRRSILIGAGRSDVCVAREASFVFAKGRLADHCEAEGIPHMRIRHLGDVVVPLARRLTLLAEAA